MLAGRSRMTFSNANHSGHEADADPGEDEQPSPPAGVGRRDPGAQPDDQGDRREQDRRRPGPMVPCAEGDRHDRRYDGDRRLGGRGRRGGRRRCGGEVAHDNQAGGGAEARVAGRQGEAVVGGGFEDGHVTRRHDRGRVHHVAEAAGGGRDEDVVSRLELVQSVERGAVGRAVPGDGGVPRFAGQRCPGVVTGPFAELGDARAVDHELVDGDRRDLEMGDRLTGGGRRGHRRRGA